MSYGKQPLQQQQQQRKIDDSEKKNESGVKILFYIQIFFDKLINGCVRQCHIVLKWRREASAGDWVKNWGMNE